MTTGNYRASGVDVDLASQAKQLIAGHAKTTFTPQVLGRIGSFAALYHLTEFQDPVLVSSTDNVGTKVKIATLAKAWECIGKDVVNQSINDIITSGARPLFFLDYIGMERLIPEQVGDLVGGMAQACRDAGCSLIGGETAELPGMYVGQGLDLAGFVVGAVEREALLTGENIEEGDVLIALPSNGLHTNGYSLVRQVFGIDQDAEVLEQKDPLLTTTLGQALLIPHRPYWPLLKPALCYLKGMAHITGGGLEGNLSRVLPTGLAALLDAQSWVIPSIFQLIERRGRIPRTEMFQVFNMGIGMVLISDSRNLPVLMDLLRDAWLLGSVTQDLEGSKVIFR